MTTLHMGSGDVTPSVPGQLGSVVGPRRGEQDALSLQIENIIACIPGVPDAAKPEQEQKFREALRAQTHAFVDDDARRLFLDNATHAIGTLTQTPRRHKSGDAVVSNQEVAEVFQAMCAEFAATYSDVRDPEERYMSHFAYGEAVDLSVQLLKQRQISLRDVCDGFSRLHRVLNDDYKVPVSYDLPEQGVDDGPVLHARPHTLATVRTLVGKCFEPFANVLEELERARMRVDFVLRERANGGIAPAQIAQELHDAETNLRNARWFYGESGGQSAAVEREITHVSQLVASIFVMLKQERVSLL